WSGAPNWADAPCSSTLVVSKAMHRGIAGLSFTSILPTRLLSFAKQTSPYESRVSRSADLDGLEGLGQSALRQPAHLGSFAEPSAQHVGEVVHLAGLAFVRAQRGDLAVEGVCDVDKPIRLRSARDPDLVDRPWLQPICRQFGKGERVPGVRVHGIEGGGADCP